MPIDKEIFDLDINEYTKLEKAKTILDFLKKHPNIGFSMKELISNTKLTSMSVKHSALALKRAGVIRSRFVGRKLYYILRNVPEDDDYDKMRVVRCRKCDTEIEKPLYINSIKFRFSKDNAEWHLSKVKEDQQYNNIVCLHCGLKMFGWLNG